MEVDLQSETNNEYPSVIHSVIDISDTKNLQYDLLLKQEVIYSSENQLSTICNDVYQKEATNLQPFRIKDFNSELSEVHVTEIPNNLLDGGEINFKTTDDESMAVEALRQLGGTYEDVESSEENLLMLSCDNCDARFNTITDLNVHTIVCKNLDYKKFRRCAFCTKMFNNEEDYKLHNCETVEQWPCKYCCEKLSTNLELIKHIRSIHNSDSRPYTCHLCYQKFPRHSSLSNHLKIHNYHPGRALFVNCDKNLIETSNTKKDNIKLPVWSSEFIPDSTICIDPLSNWNLNYNTNSIQSEQQTQDIEIEGESLIIETNFPQNEIIPQDSTDFQAPPKNEPITFEAEFEKCIEEEPFPIESIPQFEVTINSTYDDKRPHTCIHCGVSFSREKALINHIKLHSINWRATHDCENCGEGFMNLQLKTQHVKLCSKGHSSHNVYGYKPNRANFSSFKKLHNDKPASSLKSKAKTGKHPCPDCDKRFATKQKMFRHMWIHRKKTFSCEMCELTFQLQTDLDKHRLSKHSGNSPYVCNECGKSFASRQGLWEHGRVHGGGAAGLFLCQKCNKTFASRQGYLIHQRSHTGERPYGCRYCLKAFRDGGTLRKHERIHTGERPHVCPICLHDFNQKVVLREHVRWVHAAVTQKNENGLFGCRICEISVNDKEELSAHLVKHSDQMAVEAKFTKTKLGEQTSPEIKENNLTANSQLQVINDEGIKLENVKVERENTFIEDSNFLTSKNFNVEENILLDKNNVECDMCGNKFQSQKELMAHVHIHI